MRLAAEKCRLPDKSNAIRVHRTCDAIHGHQIIRAVLYMAARYISIEVDAYHLADSNSPGSTGAGVGRRQPCQAVSA